MRTIHTSYKIVEKKETRALIKILDEIKTIQKGFQAMYFFEEDPKEMEKKAIVESIVDEQIMDKLQFLYEYYEKNYNVKISDENFGDGLINEFGFEGLRIKNIENNIAEICETVRSWEE